MNEQTAAMQDEAQFQRELEQACGEACVAAEMPGPGAMTVWPCTMAGCH